MNRQRHKCLKNGPNIPSLTRLASGGVGLYIIDFFIDKWLGIKALLGIIRTNAPNHSRIILNTL